MPQELIVDRQRAKEVIRDMALAWKERRSALQGFNPPEIRMRTSHIKLGSFEHALYLFFAAWVNRSGKTAEQVISQAAHIITDHFDVINPLTPRHFLFTEIVTPAIPFAYAQPVRVEWLQESLDLLRDKYEGDPRKLFENLDIPENPDFEQISVARTRLIKRCTEFKGIGSKIAQLLIGWFQEVDCWPDPGNEWPRIRRTPCIAVDIWQMRLWRQFNLSPEESNDNREVLEKQLSGIISEICFEENISHTDFAQGGWHTGAHICGKMRPKNPTKAITFCVGNCPMINHCIGKVPADDDGRGRKSIGWKGLVPHPPNLFKTPDI